LTGAGVGGGFTVAGFCVAGLDVDDGVEVDAGVGAGTGALAKRVLGS